MSRTPAVEAGLFRKRVRAFIQGALPADWSGLAALKADDRAHFLEEWIGRLSEEGLRAPAWPREYGGGGLGPLEQAILADELAIAGLPQGAPNDLFGIGMLGPTLIQWGTDDQKAYFLPRIITGEHRWCQGFSEPDFGSDLGGVRTHAVLDGDEWVINGQKIWTSAAQTANWVFVLCRTDEAAPKHRGLSLLLCPLDHPGIEVRPIRTMDGTAHFNEIYFDEARTRREHVVGPIHGGWAVAMSLLGHERGGQATIEDLRLEFWRLVAAASDRGLDGHPVVRQRLATTYTTLQIMRFRRLRDLAAADEGRVPGPEAAITKLLWSEYHQAATSLAVDVLGADALVASGRPATPAPRTDDPDAPNCSGSWLGVFLMSRAWTILAGTSEVQRNILGELVLGLPKEPTPGGSPRGSTWEHAAHEAAVQP